IFSGGISGIVLTVCFTLIGYAVWAVIVWLVGTKVMPDPATKADLPETFRTIAFAASPGVLGIAGIIPLLGILIALVISIWQIAAMVVAVREVLDYSDYVKPVIVVIIGFVVQLIIVGMMTAMFIGGAILSS